MRRGIIILPDQPWTIARQRWQRAEAYGFDHAWTYDHVGWRELVDHAWFDAVPTLTAAALATSRLRLGTMVASPNLRHPVSFARNVTALDDISAGRLVLGIGAGGADYDTGVFGGGELTPGQRAERFEEFTELLDALVVDGAPPGQHVTSSGRWFRAVAARSTPGCVRRPRVPFVVAANGPRTMRLAARLGQGWVTTGGSSLAMARERSSDTGTDQPMRRWWSAVAQRVEQFDAALAAAGRDRSTVDRYLSLDAAPVFSLTSLSAYVDAEARAAELGFTDVLTHWPRASSWYAGDERILDELAEHVIRPAGGGAIEYAVGPDSTGAEEDDAGGTA